MLKFYPEPVKVILFGKRIFADVIKLGWSYWIIVGLKSNHGCAYNKGNLDRDTQGEYHVMTKTAIGVVHLEPKEHQRLTASTRS